MTPEEKAVIEAAMELASEAQGRHTMQPRWGSMNAFIGTVNALIFACPECNAGGHTCPGDGNPIGHTQTDCGEHSADPLPGESEPLIGRPELIEDRLGYPSSVGDANWHAKQVALDSCQCSRTERVYCHSMDCHGGADLCRNCAPLDDGASATRVDGTDERTVCDDCGAGRPEPKEWVPATLVQCLAGDHIRIGTDETDVLRSSSGSWHADISDAWRPKKWNHLELRMELVANPGFQEYPPNTPCEILCTSERKAVLAFQSAFPGSAVTSSDVD